MTTGIFHYSTPHRAHHALLSSKQDPSWIITLQHFTNLPKHNASSLPSHPQFMCDCKAPVLVLKVDDAFWFFLCCLITNPQSSNWFRLCRIFEDDYFLPPLLASFQHCLGASFLQKAMSLAVAQLRSNLWLRFFMENPPQNLISLLYILLFHRNLVLLSNPSRPQSFLPFVTSLYPLPRW